ncbi:MAG TPA: phosphodiester glycosidase family protein [Gemmatimonadaceae bacterium]|nr:phosphodiester glycosidase family protein [Gemmatimonadaceae bacterium]
MVARVAGIAVAAILVAITTSRQSPRAGGLPPSALFVRRDSQWMEWWNSERAPERYTDADHLLATLIPWRSIGPGVDVGALQLSGSGEAWRLRLVVARVAPRTARITFVPQRGIGRSAWNIDSMSGGAVVAMNGGQFHTVNRPWGWLVVNGTERQAPELRPLAMALVVDTAGGAFLLTRDEIVAARHEHSPIAYALQSYPVALVDGAVPLALRVEGHGANLAHRDGRLAICTTKSGQLLAAITRFDALDGRVPELPFGTTAPEMAAIMGSLGCWRALMLDGGISRQFGVRERGELTLRHKGWRDVPLGIEISPR